MTSRHIAFSLLLGGAAALVASPGLAAPAGHLDPSFGSGGRTTVALSESVYVGEPRPGIFVRNDAGQIYGVANPNGGITSALLRIVRLHHDGTVDDTYGTNGIVSTPLPESLDFAGYLTAAAIQQDGGLIVGLSNPVGVVCRLLPSGMLDDAFGSAQTPGCVDLGDGYVEAVVIRPDGGIVVAGRIDNWRGRVTTLLPNGMPDGGFGQQGSVILDPLIDTGFGDVAFAMNGDILVAGWIMGSSADFLVVRLDPTTGERVHAFGDAGAAVVAFDAGSFNHDQAIAVDVLPDGGIVVAGYAQTDLDGGNERAAVVKLTDAGDRDESFGPQGKRILDPCVDYAVGCDMWIYDVAVMPDERIVLAGRISPTGATSSLDDFLAMRILPDGTMDPTFKSNITPGTSAVAFELGQYSMMDQASTVFLEGERVLLAGVASVATDDPNEDRIDFAFAQLDHGKNTMYSVTPEFGSGGSLSPDVPQMAVHSDREEFVVLPEPGYTLASIGDGDGECGGGMVGDVYVTAPIVGHCFARVTFKPIDPHLFGDGFE